MMKKLSQLLKTNDMGKLQLIMVLSCILVVLVFLVVMVVMR